MAADKVTEVWAAHHAGLGALNDTLASTDRLVHASVRRKNEQLSRLQEELRGLRTRAIEREARARQTLERALHEQQVGGAEGVLLLEGSSRQAAERDDLAQLLGERDDQLKQLRAALHDQEQRALDARAEARERSRALEDRELQLLALTHRLRDAEGLAAADAAAAATMAGARADATTSDRAIESELAQLRRGHAARLEGEREQSAVREEGLRRELTAAEARAAAERARADKLADALAAAAAVEGPSTGAASTVAASAELDRLNASLERARAELGARDAALRLAREAAAAAEQLAATNVAVAAHEEIAERDATISTLRAELERARGHVAADGLQRARSGLADAELVRARTDVAAARADLDAARADAAELEAALRRKGDEVKQAADAARRARAEAESAAHDATRARAELGGTRAELERARYELERARAALSGARSAVVVAAARPAADADADARGGAVVRRYASDIGEEPDGREADVYRAHDEREHDEYDERDERDERDDGDDGDDGDDASELDAETRDDVRRAADAAVPVRAARRTAPAPDGVFIVGAGVYGEGALVLEGSVDGLPLDSTELACDVLWSRVTLGGQALPLPAEGGGRQLAHTPKAADVGCRLRATVRALAPGAAEPVRLSAESAVVRADSEVVALLADKLREGVIEFKVADTVHGGAARSLLLNLDKVKLRDGARDKTLLKEPYSRALLLSLDDQAADKFVLQLSAKKRVWLQAQSEAQRNLIALALRVFRDPAEFEVIGGTPAAAVPGSPASSAGRSSFSGRRPSLGAISELFRRASGSGDRGRDRRPSNG